MSYSKHTDHSSSIPGGLGLLHQSLRAKGYRAKVYRATLTKAHTHSGPLPDLKAEREVKILTAFRAYDFDGDGYLNAEDIGTLIR